MFNGLVHCDPTSLSFDGERKLWLLLLPLRLLLNAAQVASLTYCWDLPSSALRLHEPVCTRTIRCHGRRLLRPAGHRLRARRTAAAGVCNWPAEPPKGLLPKLLHVALQHERIAALQLHAEADERIEEERLGGDIAAGASQLVQKRASGEACPSVLKEYQLHAAVCAQRLVGAALVLLGSSGTGSRSGHVLGAVARGTVTSTRKRFAPRTTSRSPRWLLRYSSDYLIV